MLLDLRAARKGGGPHSVVPLPEVDVNATSYWAAFGRTHRLNFGSMFGTVGAMGARCAVGGAAGSAVRSEISPRPAASCSTHGGGGG